MEETPWRSGRSPGREAHGGHGEARARKRISESRSSEPDLSGTVTCCPDQKGHLSTGPLTPLASPGEVSVSFGCKSPHLPYFMLDRADTPTPAAQRKSVESEEPIRPPTLTEYLSAQRPAPEQLRTLQRPASPASAQAGREQWECSTHPGQHTLVPSKWHRSSEETVTVLVRDANWRRQPLKAGGRGAGRAQEHSTQGESTDVRAGEAQTWT